jgi:hypothetical protein
MRARPRGMLDAQYYDFIGAGVDGVVHEVTIATRDYFTYSLQLLPTAHVWKTLQDFENF